MRVFARFMLALTAAALLTTSTEARKRRAISPPSLSPSAELVLSKISCSDDKGERSFVVLAASRVPLTAGTTFYGYVRKPGEENFTPLPSTASTVEDHEAGGWRTIWLHTGLEFYDNLADGTRSYWLPGVATYKMVIRTAAGVTTSVETDVAVPRSSATASPLLAVPFNEGRNIQILGEFPSLPAVILYHEVEPCSFVQASLEVSRTLTVTVPLGFFGPASPLVVCYGHSPTKCETVEVNIPES